VSEISRIRGDEADVIDLIPALRAFARSFCKNPVDADDLVQDTLLRALDNLDKYRTGTRLKSWLFTIMRNTYCSQFKRRRRESPSHYDCVSTRPSREATQEWSIRGREIEQAILGLPPHYREVLVLIVMLDTSYEDAAKICECPVGTIKSRLNRARAGILAALGENTPQSALEVADRFVPFIYQLDIQQRQPR
jgi:RNA polymerase sigma-70 factor (ECF subfamily)